MRWSAVVAAGVLLAPLAAAAQEDTTPPVLLDFTITPTAFDTGPGPVTLDWCVTVRDDVAGVNNAVLILDPGIGRSFLADFPSGVLEGTQCAQATIQQFTAYATYALSVRVEDDIGNQRTVGTPELCAIPPGRRRQRGRPSSGRPC